MAAHLETRFSRENRAKTHFSPNVRKKRMDIPSCVPAWVSHVWLNLHLSSQLLDWFALILLPTSRLTLLALFWGHSAHIWREVCFCPIFTRKTRFKMGRQGIFPLRPDSRSPIFRPKCPLRAPGRSRGVIRVISRGFGENTVFCLLGQIRLPTHACSQGQNRPPDRLDDFANFSRGEVFHRYKN